MCACVYSGKKQEKEYISVYKMVGTERKYGRKHVLTRQVMVKAKNNRKRKGKNEKKRNKKRLILK